MRPFKEVNFFGPQNDIKKGVLKVSSDLIEKRLFVRDRFGGLLGNLHKRSRINIQREPIEGEDVNIASF